MGPLIDERAVAKMETQVLDARTKGARVVAGGERVQVDGLDGTTFFAPTLLAEDEHEVIDRANDTEYGLAAYVYTNDLSTAIRVTEKLRFGMVGINDINPTSAAAPFGGVKASGLGREGGYEGIDEYLDTKLVGISI